MRRFVIQHAPQAIIGAFVMILLLALLDGAGSWLARTLAIHSAG